MFDFRTEVVYLGATETEVSGLGPHRGDIATNSPKGPKKTQVRILNPREPGAGTMCLRSAEACVLRGVARLDRDALTLTFIEPDSIDTPAQRVDMAERAYLRKVKGAPVLPPVSALDQAAIDLWPVLPHVSGRPLDDYLEVQARNKPRR